MVCRLLFVLFRKYIFEVNQILQEDLIMHWIAFYVAGKCVCSYDLRHTFCGEYENTIALLTSEYNYDKKDISAYICMKIKGQYEKTKKIIGEKDGKLIVCSI